jgi:hypothetical protein
MVLSYLAGPVDFATVLAVIEVLSTQDDHEQYIGDPDGWMVDPATPALAERFAKFGADVKALEKDIEARNKDPSLTNRCGDFVLPYTLLMPTSGGGVTRRGVPTSISI